VSLSMLLSFPNPPFHRYPGRPFLTFCLRTGCIHRSRFVLPSFTPRVLRLHFLLGSFPAPTGIAFSPAPLRDFLFPLPSIPSGLAFRRQTAVRDGRHLCLVPMSSPMPPRTAAAHLWGDCFPVTTYLFFEDEFFVRWPKPYFSPPAMFCAAAYDPSLPVVSWYD